MVDVQATSLNNLVIRAAGVALAVCCGCGRGGPPTYPVSGSVAYAGRPVPTGSVMLVSLQGESRASGTISADGSFTLKAPAGDYKVAVSAPRELPVGEVNPDNWEQAFRATAQPYVPGFYGDPETSPLKFTVTADGTNQCDLKIPPLKQRRR